MFARSVSRSLGKNLTYIYQCVSSTDRAERRELASVACVALVFAPFSPRAISATQYFINMRKLSEKTKNLIKKIADIFVSIAKSIALLIALIKSHFADKR